MVTLREGCSVSQQEAIRRFYNERARIIWDEEPRDRGPAIGIRES